MQHPQTCALSVVIVAANLCLLPHCSLCFQAVSFAGCSLLSGLIVGTVRAGDCVCLGFVSLVALGYVFLY